MVKSEALWGTKVFCNLWMLYTSADLGWLPLPLGGSIQRTVMGLIGLERAVSGHLVLTEPCQNDSFLMTGPLCSDCQLHKSFNCDGWS